MGTSLEHRPKITPYNGKRFAGKNIKRKNFRIKRPVTGTVVRIAEKGGNRRRRIWEEVKILEKLKGIQKLQELKQLEGVKNIEGVKEEKKDKGRTLFLYGAMGMILGLLLRTAGG